MVNNKKNKSDGLSPLELVTNFLKMSEYIISELKSRYDILGIKNPKKSLLYKVLALLTVMIYNQSFKFTPRDLRIVVNIINKHIPNAIKVPEKILLQTYKNRGWIQVVNEQKHIYKIDGEFFDKVYPILSIAQTYYEIDYDKYREGTKVFIPDAKKPFFEEDISKKKEHEEVSEDKEEEDKKKRHSLGPNIPIPDYKSSLYVFKVTRDFDPDAKMNIMKGLSRGGIDFYCSTLSAYLSSAISPYISNPSAIALSKDIVIERLNAYIKHPYIFWIEDRGAYQYIFEINEFTGKYRTIVLDGVVPHFTPNLVARLFDVAVSRKGSIFVVLPDTYKKGDRALDGSEIIMVVPWLVYGVRARFEVYSTSSGLSESFDVFVPVGLWKIIISNIAKRYKVLAIEIPPTVLINPKTRRKVAKTNFLGIGIIDDTEEEAVLKNIEEEVKKIASLKTWEILRAAEVGVLGEFVKQEHVKIAVLLTAFSQGLDKLKVELPNVTLSKDYGVLYTLLIGAPSAGKSKILSTIIQYANVDLSNYAKLDAHKMTAAGITASYDRDTRGVKIGVEPINHGRIVGYDEIDKAKDIDEVISTLNSIMSDYVVTYDKANIHARFPAVSAKIFVANLYGDYSVIQNIKDLYRVIENPEELGLRRKTGLFGNYTNLFLSRIDLLVFVQRITAKDIYSSPGITEKPSIIINPTLFKNYIKYILEKLASGGFTTISSDVAEYILNRVEELHKKYPVLQSVLGLILSDPRKMITIFKLARAIAHMHLRTHVTKEDANDALAFYIFIHTYPFVKSMSADHIQQLSKFVEEFLENLGCYAKLLSPYEITTIEADTEKPEKVIVLRNKSDLVALIKAILSQTPLSDKELLKVLNEMGQQKKVILKSRETGGWKAIFLADLNDISLYNMALKELRTILDELEYYGEIILKNDGNTYRYTTVGSENKNKTNTS